VNLGSIRRTSFAAAFASASRPNEHNPEKYEGRTIFDPALSIKSALIFIFLDNASQPWINELNVSKHSSLLLMAPVCSQKI
jgi:hypothetical protein